jgi:hypothetical protein
VVQVELEAGSYFRLLIRLPVTKYIGIKFVMYIVLGRHDSQWLVPYAPISFLRSSDCIILGIHLDCQIANLFFKFDIGLSRGHEALLTFKQQSLPTSLISLVDEFITKIVDENFTVPSLSARHTVGILGGVGEVPLSAS